MRLAHRSHCQWRTSDAWFTRGGTEVRLRNCHLLAKGYWTIHLMFLSLDLTINYNWKDLNPLRFVIVIDCYWLLTPDRTQPWMNLATGLLSGCSKPPETDRNSWWPASPGLSTLRSRPMQLSGYFPLRFYLEPILLHSSLGVSLYHLLSPDPHSQRTRDWASCCRTHSLHLHLSSPHPRPVVFLCYGILLSPTRNLPLSPFLTALSL